ncbi:ComF family protein [Solimonas marina]|uniref:ComF family protein n=1 Tax=Solimonas marina TaxID=2714601 RepID=A0A969WB18_9GAMM|nr:ComF family protein [Solimonas marina]NKF22201.1 ComF family protein [Solimonas marina]
MVDIFSSLTELLAPSSCTFCAARTDGTELCASCRDALPWNTVACPRCALPQAHDGLCAHCAQHPPPFAAAWAPFRLAPPVRQQIHALKYQATFRHAQLLGRLFVDRLRTREAPVPDVVIPVPLHPTRLWRRGYNQSVELARALRRDGLRVEPRWAQRLRRTADQIGTDAVARRRQVAKAFAVDPRVAGLRVALLDDVMTTGATLAELARTCRRAGAAEVEAWAIARAP